MQERKREKKADYNSKKPALKVWAWNCYNHFQYPLILPADSIIWFCIQNAKENLRDDNISFFSYIYNMPFISSNHIFGREFDIMIVQCHKKCFFL